MRIINDFDISVIKEITESRPKADHTIEQYLMTHESLFLQLSICQGVLDCKRVLFLGDDDPIVPLLINSIALLIQSFIPNPSFFEL